MLMSRFLFDSNVAIDIKIIAMNLIILCEPSRDFMWAVKVESPHPQSQSVHGYLLANHNPAIFSVPPQGR